MKEHIFIQINIVYPYVFKVVFDAAAPIPKAMIYEKTDEEWSLVKEIKNVAAKEIFEIEIPFSDIKTKENDEIHFSITVMKNGDEIERCPWRGHVTVIVPPVYYEAMMWY
jgi:hypothetical protein